MRNVIVTLPLLALSIAVAASPAAAKADERCTTVPAAVKAAAASASDRAAAGVALRHIAVGEQLCAAGNERAAAKKFRAAAEELGMEDKVQLAAGGR